MNYDPAEIEWRDEQLQLHRRARKAARTFEEQERFEDDAPLRRARLCRQLHAAGIRGWMPPLDPNRPELWVYSVAHAEFLIRQNRVSSWGDRREDTFRTRSYLDACDSMEKTR